MALGKTHKLYYTIGNTKETNKEAAKQPKDTRAAQPLEPKNKKEKRK
jgi:hypothetical protein